MSPVLNTKLVFAKMDRPQASGPRRIQCEHISQMKAGALSEPLIGPPEQNTALSHKKSNLKVSTHF